MLFLHVFVLRDSWCKEGKGAYSSSWNSPQNCVLIVVCYSYATHVRNFASVEVFNKALLTYLHSRIALLSWDCLSTLAACISGSRYQNATTYRVTCCLSITVPPTRQHSIAASINHHKPAPAARPSSDQTGLPRPSSSATKMSLRADVIEIYETYDWVIWCCSWAACCDWLVDKSVGNAARGFTTQLTNKIMIKDSALQMNWQSLARISVTDRDVDRQTDRQTGLQQHSVIHLDQQPTSILVVCV